MTNPAAKARNIRNKSILKTIGQQKFLISMIVPGLVFLFIFYYLPMIGIIMSFQDYNFSDGFLHSPFVGFKHYRALFEGRGFPNVLKNTIGISFFKLLLGFPMPILFALMLNEVKRDAFKRTVQTLSYLPHFISWTIAAGMIISFLSKEGSLNYILISLGIIKEGVNYLIYPDNFWGILVITNIWKDLGWNAIIYISALATIDIQLYEAAKMTAPASSRKFFISPCPELPPLFPSC